MTSTCFIVLVGFLTSGFTREPMKIYINKWYIIEMHREENNKTSLRTTDDRLFRVEETPDTIVDMECK